MPSWSKIGARPTHSVTLTGVDQVIYAGKCFYCGASIRATSAATITLYDTATLPASGTIIGTTSLNPAANASVSVSFDRPRQVFNGITAVITGGVIGTIQYALVDAP